MKLRWLIPITLLLASAACSGDGSTPSRSDCLAMRVHVVDLQLAVAGGGAGAEAEIAKHRKIRLASNVDGYVDSCQSHQTPDSIECALAAKSLDEYRSCN